MKLSIILKVIKKLALNRNFKSNRYKIGQKG
jgi:hypothetical protein